MVFAVEFFGRADVFVDWFEPAMDALVLGLVEILQLFGFVSGMIEGDRAITVTFSRSIGTDKIYLAAGLELGGELIRIMFSGVVGRLILNVRSGRRGGGEVVTRSWGFSVIVRRSRGVI